MPYDRPARVIHWTTALAVLAMIPAGLIMVREGLPRALQDTLFVFHKNTGVAVLLVMLLRAAWRATHPVPEHTGLPAWQKRAARLNHAALYALLFVMPLSGYVRVRAGGFPIEALDAMGVRSLVPRSDRLAEIAQVMHYFAGWALIAAVALHILGALHHSLVRRDGLIRRMWPPL